MWKRWEKKFFGIFSTPHHYTELSSKIKPWLWFFSKLGLLSKLNIWNNLEARFKDIKGKREFTTNTKYSWLPLPLCLFNYTPLCQEAWIEVPTLSNIGHRISALLCVTPDPGKNEEKWMTNARLGTLSSGNEIHVVILVFWVGAD